MVHHYGYVGLSGVLVLGIVGLPLPDETLLTLVGYLVYRGHLAYFPAAFAGIFGAGVGITLSYLVGGFVGRPAIVRFGRYVRIREQELDRVARYLDRFGGVTVFAGFFVPGVRHVTAIVAGLGGMPFARFALPAYVGACVWVTVFITLGRFLGPEIDALHPQFILYLGIGLAILAAIAFAVGVGFKQYWSRR